MESVLGSAGGKFVVAGRRVDAAANVVEWRGETVHLEPKVMRLLVCLAAHEGRVVSRADLENEVWTGTVVGYDAITQTVSKLRKALGEDPHHPRILETVAKSGYRLIAPVEPDTPKPAALSPKPTGSDADQRARGRVAAGRVPKVLTARVIWATIALLIALAVPLAWLLLRPYSGQPAAPEAPSLAVLPFENLSGERDLDYLVDAITEDVTTALAADTAIHVLAARSAFGAEDAETEPTILARRLGARYLVEGSIQMDGIRLNINVRLTDTSTNRHLWAKQYEQQVENVFPVVDDITLHVTSVLLPKRSTATTPPVVDSDPEPASELGYDALIDSPKRLKCLYGNVAQIGGDHATAARIFEDCIERWNDVRSMIALAHILELGVGVAQDLPRATLLLRRGAYTDDLEGYSSLARYHYGMALLLGRGINPNSVEGFKWLRRAAAEGVDDAREYLNQHFPHQLPEYHLDGDTEAP